MCSCVKCTRVSGNFSLMLSTFLFVYSCRPFYMYWILFFKKANLYISSNVLQIFQLIVYAQIERNTESESITDLQCIIDLLFVILSRMTMPYGMAWRAWHGIWYGLPGMAWYIVWPGGHGRIYGMAWRAWHVWPGGHGMVYDQNQKQNCLLVSCQNDNHSPRPGPGSLVPTLFARSFRRRFFAYYYAVNHPHTNIILSWFSIPLVLKCGAKILKIGLQIKI